MLDCQVRFLSLQVIINQERDNDRRLSFGSSIRQRIVWVLFKESILQPERKPSLPQALL